MNTATARLRIMFIRTIRKVRRFNARILKKDMKTSTAIVILSTILPIIGTLGFMAGRKWITRPTAVVGLVLVGGFVIGLLACFALRIKGMKKRLIVVGLVLLCAEGWMFIGGIDCEPPKDDDLLIPESTNNVPPCDNAFVAITNLARKAYAVDENYKRVCDAMCMDDLLSFYVDPKENNLCYDGSLDVFMDRQRTADAIEAALASNKTLLAIYDHAAACETFLPPPINEYDPLADEDYSITDLITFARNVLPARIKHAAQKGDFAKAVSLFKKDIEFARRISETPSTLVDYLVARYMMSLAVGKMARTIREYDFPDAELGMLSNICQVPA